MVATLQLARTVADRDLCDAALAHGVEHALTFLSVEHDDEARPAGPYARPPIDNFYELTHY